MMLLEAIIPEAGYGKKIILHNIAFTIEKQWVVSIIGPNGAGKSTLLKALAGLVKFREGKITLDGNDITALSPEQRVKRGLSFLPQGNKVFDELSVQENLEIGGYLLKCSEEKHSRMDETLQLFPDLKNPMKRNAGKLSGGEKQQLAIARALMLKPKVLLMDEPSLGLAPKLIASSFETIRRIGKEYGMTILLVEQKVREVL
jgi:branched-chain amino acid transport system ATP-binding protein